jgi:hypothetical protein
MPNGKSISPRITNIEPWTFANVAKDFTQVFSFRFHSLSMTRRLLRDKENRFSLSHVVLRVFFGSVAFGYTLLSRLVRFQWTHMGIFSFGSNPGDNKPTERPKDTWSVAKGTNNGCPMFLRVNDSLKPLASKPPFDHRFGVAVPLRAPDEQGLPTKEESEELNRIEDTLTATFTRTGKTVFAVAITTSGFREFVFYTSVAREIMPTMERLKNEITSHTVQFYVKPDPTWGLYLSFAK